MERIKVGIFSPNDFRAWVREANLKNLIAGEAALKAALESRGVEAVCGGDGLPDEDRIAWNTALVRKHASRLAAAAPDAIVIHHGDWSWPYDARDAVQLFAEGLRGESHGIARVLIYCHKEPEVPGLVAGMASAGALRRVGMAYQLVYGRIDRDPALLDRIMEILEFYRRRARCAGEADRAIAGLRGKKYLALGGMSLKMCTGTADADQWAKLFGVTYDAFDQSELTKRARAMVRWQGQPGRSRALEILDGRVEAARSHMVDGGHGKFDFSRAKLSDINIFLYQLSYYYAAVDVLGEQDGDFMGIKCQDELSGHECTQCVAAAFLNNDVGPEGAAKPPVPTACENDMDSALTQMMLSRLNGGKPAGFGDFRDVENGVLAIVNCGQHPPYFFGRADEDGAKKLDYAEYVGQEIWYHAGGAAVRGRTPGGQAMTVARLYRENLRYALVAMAVQTVQPGEDAHRLYSPSWPVILAKTPVGGEQVVGMWPCNHLGFAYGDLTAHLVELAERLGIGYTVVDSRGVTYRRES